MRALPVLLVCLAVGLFGWWHFRSGPKALAIPDTPNSGVHYVRARTLPSPHITVRQAEAELASYPEPRRHLRCGKGVDGWRVICTYQDTTFLDAKGHGWQKVGFSDSGEERTLSAPQDPGPVLPGVDVARIPPPTRSITRSQFVAAADHACRAWSRQVRELPTLSEISTRSQAVAREQADFDLDFALANAGQVFSDPLSAAPVAKANVYLSDLNAYLYHRFVTLLPADLVRSELKQVEADGAAFDSQARALGLHCSLEGRTAQGLPRASNAAG